MKLAEYILVKVYIRMIGRSWHQNGQNRSVYTRMIERFGLDLKHNLPIYQQNRAFL